MIFKLSCKGHSDFAAANFKGIVVRSEKDADGSNKRCNCHSVFRTLEIINHTEQLIIEALRAAKALMIALVAVISLRYEIV